MLLLAFLILHAKLITFNQYLHQNMATFLKKCQFYRIIAY